MSDAATTPVTKTAWKQAAGHTVTCPSGAVVKIKVLNLPVLLKAGALPDTLLDLAKASVAGTKEITDEMIEALPEFQSYLVSEAVVEPKVKMDEVADVVPYEDVELICDIATRQRDVDAIGHQIGGLEKIDDWRRFRGFPTRDAALDDEPGLE